MNDAANRMIATAAVLAGATLFQLGIPLDPGAFAGEIDNHQARGVVVATAYFSVKIKSEADGLVTFFVAEKNKMARHEVGQLRKGDQVTILWSREDGRKWVRDVAVEGVLKGQHRTRGVVVATAYFFVKIKSEEDGLVSYFVAENDKMARHKVGQLLTGDQVAILWSSEDGRKWVRDVARERVLKSSNGRPVANEK